jgi:hypothetical protein
MKLFRLCLLFSCLPRLAMAAAPAPDPALEDRAWLTEVVRYCYYWYLDDAFFAAVHGAAEVEVWVRPVEPHQRDADDRSRFAEAWLPQAKVLLALKKADYRIEELDLSVKSDGYRVVRGSYEEAAPGDPAEWRMVGFPREALLAELVAGRAHLHAPAPATRELALAAMRREFQRAGDVRGPQKLYVAARTDVSTQVWVFWEDRRVLLQISGDMDALAPELKAHLPLLVRRYPLGTNVVASTLEMEGRNAFISRDLASRALFVCVARGEAVVLEP